jgi:hypothetical protein
MTTCALVANDNCRGKKKRYHRGIISESYFAVRSWQLHTADFTFDLKRYHRGIQNLQRIVISVSKAYIHRGRRFQHRQSTKKRWHVYYYEVDSTGKFTLKTMRVNWLQALFFKTKRKRRFKYYCSECRSTVIALLKSKKSTLVCPICGTA